jgi:DNA replication protein DnaC
MGLEVEQTSKSYHVNYAPTCLCHEYVRRELHKIQNSERDIRNEKVIQQKIRENKPGRFETASVKTWPGKHEFPNTHKKSCDFVDQFTNSSAGGMLLLGGVGTGKTCLLYGVVNDLIRRGYNCVVVNVAQWIQDINMRISAGVNTGDLIRPLYNAHIVALVDLGKENTTLHTHRTMYLLLEHRWQQQKPVIVDSNFHSIGALRDHYGGDPVMSDAISSRLLGMCKGNVHVLNKATDNRLK